MKLLLAEDEVDMSEALVDILTYHKYTVDAVFDGEEALDYATIGEYDGIILDIMMPKMSGLEVLQKLRNRGDRTPCCCLRQRQKLKTGLQGWIWEQTIIYRSHLRWASCLRASGQCSGARKNLLRRS